jgi:hypothetical protein
VNGEDRIMINRGIKIDNVGIYINCITIWILQVHIMISHINVTNMYTHMYIVLTNFDKGRSENKKT